ncbi:MAG: aminomethyl-transferring glycine dehydrogenase subunit GcvPA [Proteobacteria bacterium]|nr:aminomethyl-transferring glycine dehydrogenase subunit GcvPA [Pseudomonadota bacterium]
MRYLPHTPAVRRKMLQSIEAHSIDDLFEDVPQSVLVSSVISGLPFHKSEFEVEQYFKRRAPQTDKPFFLGAGCYRHHIPASVDYFIQRGEFLTSYTPYQPEISQGTLQYLFEFQTQVALLTGMEVANASMYDGATACVEAVMMACRLTGRKKALLSSKLHPHYGEVVDTYARWCTFTSLGLQPSMEQDERLTDYLSEELSCVVVQYPDFFGHIQDFRDLADQCHQKGILLIVVCTEVLALGLLLSPGEMGADIVVGEGQSLGVGLQFGGPSLGLFATHKKFVRQMPGRLVGETVDVEGQRGWVLTLSTREQHIRREKATSNICTNSGLCALAFTIHLTLLGEKGLKNLAQLNHQKALNLKKELNKISSLTILNQTFFNEFTIKLPTSAEQVVEKLAQKGILAGVPLSRFFGKSFDPYLLMAITETVTDADQQALIDALCEVL